ncbi:MAG: type II toxin-antitoxin system PemK/MazF family toxin [Caldilineaceae bacterium]|nr:type II toxin-antitoxin system PemK/MazF family toxin [Caldilineaceae bacterium]
MRRGEVYWFTFRAPDKRRPVLVLTRTSALSFLASVTVAPLTTTIRDIPTEVRLTPEDDGVVSLCAVNLDNIQTVARHQLKERMTLLSDTRMRAVDAAILFALGIDDPG